MKCSAYFVWSQQPLVVLFQSLYPFVNKTKCFPLGHPSIITENFGALDSVQRRFKGLIKCRILPPEKLYLPVLFYKARGKLMFTLCASCSNSGLNERCPHSDRERVLNGVYTHIELEKAVSLGYKMVSVSEIWHWERWSDQIFADYIKCFFKVRVFFFFYFPPYREIKQLLRRCITECLIDAYVM